MIRATGGFACGATSTRSRSAMRARSSASWTETIPIWAPSAPTSRTWGARMRSLMRGSTETRHHLRGRRGRELTSVGGGRSFATVVYEPWSHLLDRADVGRLLTLRPVDDVELDLLALGERLVAVTLNRREVHEYVVTVGAGDEAIPLLVAEPLDRSLGQPVTSLRSAHRYSPGSLTHQVRAA